MVNSLFIKHYPVIENGITHLVFHISVQAWIVSVETLHAYDYLARLHPIITMHVHSLNDIIWLHLFQVLETVYRST